MVRTIAQKLLTWYRKYTYETHHKCCKCDEWIDKNEVNEHTYRSPAGLMYHLGCKGRIRVRPHCNSRGYRLKHQKTVVYID